MTDHPPQGTMRLTNSSHEELEQIVLEVEEGPQKGERFTAESDQLVVGSHPSAGACLSDPSVSRFHCELAVQEGKIRLTDLGSLNGTYVNDVEVKDAVIGPQHAIVVGGTKLRLQAGEQVRIPLSPRLKFHSMIGCSPSIRRVFAMLEKVAESSATVLLTGETGTGKEIAAESLHLESPRKDEALVVVDCGAIPEELLESELFGHERGAFTGAVSARDGAFGEADGGTIFLDEIGELPLALQPKLLRVLERRQIKRVGSSKYRPVDVRVLAATHRDLRKEVNRGRFREDLYYRLAVVEVKLPPLRERPEDLPYLLEAILASLSVSDEKADHLRSEQFLESLQKHKWPGNVRELRNYIERCLALQEQVPIPMRDPSEPSGLGILDPVDIKIPFKKAKEQAIAIFEAKYLTQMLAAHDGNVREAAKAAGIDRVYAYRLLRRYGLK